MPLDFHPEFGYFVPSLQTRRLMRIALIATVVGALSGGAGVLALVPQYERAQASADTKAATVPIVAVAETTAAPLKPEARFEPVVDKIEPIPEHAAPCAEQTSLDVDRKCLDDIGRRDEAPEAGRMPITDPRTQREPVRSADIESKKPSESFAPSDRKRRSVERRTRDRSRYGDERNGSNAYALSRYGRDGRSERVDEEDFRGQTRREARQDRREREELRRFEREFERDRLERPERLPWRPRDGGWLFGP